MTKSSLLLFLRQIANQLGGAFFMGLVQYPLNLASLSTDAMRFVIGQAAGHNTIAPSENSIRRGRHMAKK